jgi:uncharacterized protein (TIGR02145 family)
MYDDSVNYWGLDAVWASTDYGARTAQFVSCTGLINYDYDWPYLYNGYAVLDPRGVCPNGFHVPTDQDWRDLEEFLGMSISELYDWGARGTDQGQQMKNSTGWVYPWFGTNSSGFTGVKTGRRMAGGNLNGSCEGYFWTSSGYYQDGNLIYRHLLSNSHQVRRSYQPYGTAMAIRCVQD